MLAPSENEKTGLTPNQQLGVHLFLGLVICAGALILFYMIATAVVSNGALVELDQNIATALHAWATPGLTQIMILISLLGLQVLWVVVGVVAIYYLIKRRWAHLGIWLVGFAGAELLTQVIKMTFQRARPDFDDPLLTALNYSFPSGHALVSLVMYGLLGYFVLLNLHNAWSRNIVVLVTVLIVLWIGISRIYLGVHFFSDVMAGFVAGTIWLTLCIDAMDYIETKHLARRRVGT
jgi:membrane-associated phospholipid phosphatase